MSFANGNIWCTSVYLRSIEHQETWAINMYSIERYFMLSENETHRETCRYASGVVTFRFKDRNETSSTSSANCNPKNFSFFLFGNFSRSRRENIRYTRIKELWSRMKLRHESEVQRRAFRSLPRIESGRTFWFSRSSLLTKSTKVNRRQPLPSTRRGGRVKLNFGIIILWFHFPAWDERGCPRAFV